jgi:hypothetical protein
VASLMFYIIYCCGVVKWYVKYTPSAMGKSMRNHQFRDVIIRNVLDFVYNILLILTRCRDVRAYLHGIFPP